MIAFRPSSSLSVGIKRVIFISIFLSNPVTMKTQCNKEQLLLQVLGNKKICVSNAVDSVPVMEDFSPSLKLSLKNTYLEI